MATDFFFSSPSVVAGLFVAGVGAVLAYTQLGAPGHSTQTPHHAHPTHPDDIDGDLHESDVKNAASPSGSVRRGRRKKRAKGAAGAGTVGEDGAQGDVEASDEKGQGKIGTPVVVPGGFDTGLGIGAGVDAGVVSREASSVGMASQQANSGKTKKKRGKGKGKGKGKTEGEEEDKVEGSETDKEADIGRRASHGPRSGNSTDASVSLPPPAVSSSRMVGKGNLRASTRLATPSQPHDQDRAHVASSASTREIRSSPSLSFDTDSSWTHVDHRRLKMTDSVEGQGRTRADSAGMTSSDLASTASESPVAERMDGVATDVRGTRANLVQQTLAEKLVPRPRKTDVDDMLERPDVPALARVMRVQPLAGDAPAPGFSWDDYGDIANGDSLLVDDADEEDEGEWGVVKSRRRNRTQLPQTTTSMPSHAPETPPTMTKKQRQNARKRELAKSAKAEAETARLEGLAKHKRELERLRSIEQARS